MLTDKVGNRLFRKIEVRVIHHDNIFPPKLFVQHAPPRQGFNDDSIDQMLMNIADRLDELYPWWEFNLVPLASKGRTARYVFTPAGTRAMPRETVVPATDPALLLPQFSNINPQESSDPASDMATGNGSAETEIAETEPQGVVISGTGFDGEFYAHPV